MPGEDIQKSIIVFSKNLLNLIVFPALRFDLFSIIISQTKHYPEMMLENNLIAPIPIGTVHSTLCITSRKEITLKVYFWVCGFLHAFLDVHSILHSKLFKTTRVV
ncbi:hypothetical protein KQX54_007447 [Cotesia glomerata]|uniref:Uncharacterized protein n=1 Tax=Cotesia glomerata TaxID=32391 RepID=A0AAV7I3B9_COTGL|nr:hypothetical protein KQX54_007447 [Cotesia glomerata]